MVFGINAVAKELNLNSGGIGQKSQESAKKGKRLKAVVTVKI